LKRTFFNVIAVLCLSRVGAPEAAAQKEGGRDDEDDVFSLFLQKQKIGAKPHIYL
jgi:hypothetical protein